MRDYAKISPKLWVGKTGRAIRKMGIESQILSFYLLTSPHANMLGVYYLPIAYITHDLGLTEQAVISGLEKLNELDFCNYDPQAEYVWIIEMARHQIAQQLEERDKRVKAVNDIFHSLPELCFKNDIFTKYKNTFHLQPWTDSNKKIPEEFEGDLTSDRSPFQGALMPLRSQEQEQEKEQEKNKEKEKEQKQIKEVEHKALTSRNDDQKNSVRCININSPISIPLRQGVFQITKGMIEQWENIYPFLDILQELKTIRSWNLANQNKRKTSETILSHINHWLEKSNCKGTNKNSVGELVNHNTKAMIVM